MARQSIVTEPEVALCILCRKRAPCIPRTTFQTVPGLHNGSVTGTTLRRERALPFSLSYTSDRYNSFSVLPLNGSGCKWRSVCYNVHIVDVVNRGWGRVFIYRIGLILVLQRCRRDRCNTKLMRTKAQITKSYSLRKVYGNFSLKK